MYREELEEALESIIGSSFTIKTLANGKLVIHTSLIETPDGRIVDEDENNDEDDNDLSLDEGNLDDIEDLNFDDE